MSAPHPRAVMGLVASCAFVTALDNTVVNVALPSVQRDLGLTVSGLEWVATAYVLGFSCLLLPGGRLADLVGRRRTLLWGLALFTAFSAACGLAGSAGSGGGLIAFRAAQGAGAALVVPAALAVVASDLRGGAREAAIGAWTAALAAALALGPVVGGVVSERWSWEWIFYLNVPFGLAAMVLTRYAVPPGGGGRGGVRALDAPGTALSAFALGWLTHSLIEGPVRGFGSGAVAAGFVLAAAGAAAFCAAEARAGAPLLDLRLLRVPSFGGGTLAQVLWGTGVNGVFFFTALFLQQVLGFGPVRAGLAFLPLALLLVAAAPLVPRLAAAWGTHRVVCLGLLLVSAGLLAVSAVDEGGSWLALQPGLALIGVGSALTVPLTTAALADVDGDRVGMASGAVSAAREVSGVFGIALIGAVLTHRQDAAARASRPPAEAFTDGYALGLRVAAALVAAGAVVAAATLRRRGRRPAPREASPRPLSPR